MPNPPPPLAEIKREIIAKQNVLDKIDAARMVRLHDTSMRDMTTSCSECEVGVFGHFNVFAPLRD